MAKFGIGQAVRRVEDQRFLLGRGRYVDDITCPANATADRPFTARAMRRIKRGGRVQGPATAPGVLCVSPAPMLRAEKLGSFTAHLMPEDFGAPKGHRTFQGFSRATRRGSSATAWPSWLQRRSLKPATRPSRCRSSTRSCRS